MPIALRSAVFAALCVAPIAASTPLAFAQGLMPGQFVGGQVIVGSTTKSNAPLMAALAARGLSVIERDDVSGALLVSVDVGKERAACDELRTLAGVAYVELNDVGGVGITPNDTFFGQQWHHVNTGQTSGTTDADIDSDLAWELETGSVNTVIAVLDTGIDSDNPEFAGRIAPGGFDFVDEDDDPEDTDSHGTLVSGCIGANANNSFSGAGVDWACKILPIRVVNPGSGSTSFNISQGINYCAINPDVDVISMSLINGSGSNTLINALALARANGKIVLACAGNGGLGNADVSWPGASPDVISIGATRHNDERAGFSGTGQALDIVAPGESIRTTRFNSPVDRMDVVSGCSLATPITAGVVGLLLAKAEEFDIVLTHDQVASLLYAGAEDMVGLASEDTPGRDDYMGHGRLNARNSLDELIARASCADWDLSGGQPDSEDFLAYLSDYAAQNIRADLAPHGGNGVLDSSDFLAFLNLYSQGC
ncbi:MAG: S8 family serine peptidase [Phycisphaerales bacterium]|jgi:subtilisin family serine protease|nr:S8 family serine peptidase [Phycisphaerales bacterium]